MHFVLVFSNIYLLIYNSDIQLTI